MNFQYDVIVVGAGVVGLSAALMAAQQGMRVAVVEAQTSTAWQEDCPDLRVYALALDNQNLFEKLAVWDGVLARRATPYRAMTVLDEIQNSALHFHASDLGYVHLGHIVENSALVTALWEQVGKQKTLHVYCPDTVQAIDNGAESVRVHLRSGVQLQAKILIGADGARSKVRELVAVETDNHDYQQKAIVAFVNTVLPHQFTAWQRFLSTGPLAFLPFADHRCSIVWSVPSARADALMQMDAERFCGALDTAFIGTLGALHLCSERAVFPLKRQLAKTMMQGRTLLLGDAAHAVHPLAGQGVNLGLRDVAALQKLCLISQQKNNDMLDLYALQRWARQRFSDNALAAYTFEQINRIFSNENFALSLVRGSLLGIANTITPLKNTMARYAAGV